MQLTMEHADDRTPRLTPEEADARAAALIAQYRNETGARRSSPRSFGLTPGLGWAVVYLAGVFGGTVFHAKPLIAVLIGAPVVLIARALMSRRGPDARADLK